MAWYNPLTWFSSSSPSTEIAPTPVASPTGGPYGGRKRKTYRKKTTKRSRTGKKPTRP